MIWVNNFENTMSRLHSEKYCYGGIADADIPRFPATSKRENVAV